VRLSQHDVTVEMDPPNVLEIAALFAQAAQALGRLRVGQAGVALEDLQDSVGGLMRHTVFAADHDVGVRRVEQRQDLLGVGIKRVQDVKLDRRLPRQRDRHGIEVARPAPIEQRVMHQEFPLVAAAEIKPNRALRATRGAAGEAVLDHPEELRETGSRPHEEEGAVTSGGTSLSP
jgi:hypothetical protein